MKLAAVVAVVAIAVMAGGFVALHDRVWWRDYDVTVLRDGAPDASAAAYRTSGGVIVVRSTARDETYAVTADGADVFLCGAPRDVSVFGVALVSRDAYLPCIRYDGVKATDCHFVRGDGFVEFDGRNGGRFRVVGPFRASVAGAS